MQKRDEKRCCYCVFESLPWPRELESPFWLPSSFYQLLCQSQAGLIGNEHENMKNEEEGRVKKEED